MMTGVVPSRRCGRSWIAVISCSGILTCNFSRAKAMKLRFITVTSLIDGSDGGVAAEPEPEVRVVGRATTLFSNE